MGPAQLAPTKQAILPNMKNLVFGTTTTPKLQRTSKAHTNRSDLETSLSLDREIRVETSTLASLSQTQLTGLGFGLT